MTQSDYASLLAATAGRALGDLGDQLGAAMAEALPPAGITPPLRLAHFLGQTCEETGGFKWFAELGGPDYFEKYDGRADLGNSQPGDGYRFRGRGSVMLTGRSNYSKYGAELGLDLLNDPDLAAEPEAGMRIAAAYWVDHGLNDLADADNVEAITRKVNGGLNGFLARVQAVTRAKAALATLEAEPDPETPTPAQPPAPPMPAEPLPAAEQPPEPQPAPAPPGGLGAAMPDLNVLRQASKHVLSALVGFGAGAAALLGWAQKHPLDAALLGFTAALLVIIGLWLAEKFGRQHVQAVKGALAAPPQLTGLSPQDLQRIAALAAMLAQSSQGAPK